MLFSDFCIRIYPYCTKYSNYKDLFDDLAKATKTEFDYSDSYKEVSPPERYLLIRK